MKVKLVPILVIALIIAPLIAPMAYAADNEGNASLSASVEVKAAAPTVSFTLYSDSSYTTSTTEMTPQTDTYMKITVSTDNQMKDVQVTVHLYADTDNTQVGTVPSTTDPSTHVKFTISYDVNSGWVISVDDGTAGGSTWSIQLDSSKTRPSPTATSGDFYVIIKPGKTAREANTGDTAPYADWDIKAIAQVGDQSGEASSFGYTMYFYSEVSLGASSISFGQVSPGGSAPIASVDGDDTKHSFTVTVISNGYYNLKVTSSSEWQISGGGSDKITLTTGTPGTGEFALKADDAGDSNGNPTQENTIGSTLSDSQALIDNPADPTDERGASHTVYMKIYLGTGIAVGTYSGTVTVTAVDGA